MINVQNYRKGFGSCPDCPVSIEFLLIHTGNVLLFFKSKFDKEKCDDKQEHFYHLILWMAFGKVFLNRKYSLKTPKCMPSFSSLPVAWIVVFVGLILARGPYVWHPWSKPDNNIFSLLFNRLLFFYLSPVIILVSSYLVCSHCTFSIWIHSEHTKHALPVRQRYPLSVTLPVFWDRHCPEANLWYWVILKFYVSACDNIKPKSGPWCPFSRLAKS